MNFSRINECFQTITDEDVLEAMREIPGYLDITPSDFIEVYGSLLIMRLTALRQPFWQSM